MLAPPCPLSARLAYGVAARFVVGSAVPGGSSMKIAQVAPLWESVPPRFYGGTERIVSYLTEELVREGHEVALFASGDSHTSAKLVPCGETSLRLNPDVKDWVPYHVRMLEEVRQR